MAELWDRARSAVSHGSRAPNTTGMQVGLSQSSQHCQPNEVRALNFPLASAGRDNPQGSFDCVQQTGSSSGALQLKHLGSGQNKITAGGKSNSQETTRERMTQAGKVAHNPNTRVTRPEGPFSGRKAEVRRAPQSTADPVPERKRTTPLNPASITRRVFRGVSRRPFRDRVIHLLALRNYKKPELLAHLQRDGVKQKDRNCLGKTLQQVANLNVKDNSFSLKEHFYKDIQRDWPGYSETERQSLELILSRKAASTSNATCSSHLPSQGPSDREAPSRTPQKRPLDSSSTCPVMNKKQRIDLLPHGIQPAASGLCPASSGLSPKSIPPLKVSETVSSIFPCTSEGQKKQTPQTPFGIPVPATLQGESPKSTGRKEEMEKWKKSHPLDFSGGVEETFSASTDPASSGEQPDYLIKYVAIVSWEQRQSYKDDFNAEYGEYQSLLTRIDNIMGKFRRFNEEWKVVTQESKAQEMLCHQILSEYQEIHQCSPSYSELKERCQYLHKKLSHIKRLIQEFDEQQEESWHGTSAAARTHL